MWRRTPLRQPAAATSPKGEELSLRIDRYLHCIRLVKSRTLAQALVEEGHVRIDGKRVAKPSEPVRIGSIIALPLNGAVRIIEVIAHPDGRGPPSEARCAYRELGLSGD